ncbi:helix-turn-helix domain-containing protein [Avibacterium sp. 21-599]|uniref:helix-turn-helix domain-containing protein n=1 Tax=Avibacterium sp. 21-599 TaxID=2911528 RepID=UPI002E0DBB19
MKINEKIRALREINQWSQEEMAEKIQMSKNGYAKMERGESKINLSRLEQIAEVFNLDIIELISSEEKNLILQVIGNDGANNHYGNTDGSVFEIEKLNLIINHKDELLKQKER